MKVDPQQLVEVPRGLLLHTIALIGKMGTGSMPFGEVAETVATLQAAAMKGIDPNGEPDGDR